MTAFPDFEMMRLPGVADWTSRQAPAFRVTNTYWGYRVDGRRAPLWLIGMQGVCWVMGVVMIAAAIGLWAVPGSDGGTGVMAFKLGASVPLAGIATLLLWHSSRGATMGIEVDLRLGEVREVLSNRAGRTAVLARYGFDAIGGVHLDRTVGRGEAVDLVLRYRNTAQVLRVARGLEDEVVHLRDRLGRDLMVGRRKRVAEVAEAAMEVATAA